jgi:hypothetical protein
MLGGGAQLTDLSGDGRLDVVMFDGPLAGFYERADDGRWNDFRPFPSRLNRTIADPNLRFIDLDGDGHPDVLITEDDVLTWHQSLDVDGFGPAQRVFKERDEEKGPALVFAADTQSIYLADISGDGLTDLVRIRNGEVCYWPNLGYGRFGAQVMMDDAPWFDVQDHFDQKRIRLADIDGSGTTDLIYLGRNGVRLFFNRSGNSWSRARTISGLPHLDAMTSVQVADLLGNGTVCLVWSSPLPGDSTAPMLYVDLMGGRKPHLLIGSRNNLGAETWVSYAASTKFYLADRAAGRPWITRLPFPVHVVERTETYDRIGRNRFVTRYSYHHGHYDGKEREFRGFGLVEQWDTEEMGPIGPDPSEGEGDNWDAASIVPPILTRTWFHTGAFVEEGSISKQYEAEYYREGDPTGGLLRETLLEDTVLPEERAGEEVPEAYRALKGSVLRREIYALDRRSDTTLSEESDRPYTVSERNYTVRRLQPR